MGKEIYVVVYEWKQYRHIKGYFTSREEADKYCAKHSAELHVEVISCLDNKEDLSDVKLKYEYHIHFDKRGDKWIVANKPYTYNAYISDYLKSNSLLCVCDYAPKQVLVNVNLEKNDIKLAEETAQDILNQFLVMCYNEPISIAVHHINTILHYAEIERKREEQRKREAEELKQRELAELKRLKEKYESQ